MNHYSPIKNARRTLSRCHPNTVHHAFASAKLQLLMVFYPLAHDIIRHRRAIMFGAIVLALFGIAGEIEYRGFTHD